MFHPIKGKNIKFDENKITATWSPVDTGGQIFSCQYLGQGHELTLDMSGTGGVKLGITDRNPNEGGQNVCGYGTEEENYQFLNDVKIHKRSCKIHVRIDYKKQEVTSIYGTGVYTQRLKTDKPYWLVVDVKYGVVEVKIQDKDGIPDKYYFSKSCGNNIEVNGSSAKSLCKNPASICMYESPVMAGLKLKLHGTPVPYQGTTPGRFYVRLFVTATPPENLKKLHPDRFDIVCPRTENPQWTEIETFEKEHCHGTIILEVHNNHIKYKSAIGKTSHQPYTNRLSEDVWLVLELYGVSVQIESMFDERVDENREMDVPDAKRLPARDMSQSNATKEGSTQPKTTSTATSIDHNLDSNFQYNPVPVSSTSRHDQPVQCIRDSNVETATNAATSSEGLVNLAEGIQNNFTQLLKSFIPKGTFVDLLFEKRYITYEQLQRMEETGQQDQARAVLFIMMKRPIQRKLLEQALNESQQEFLLPKFLNEVEKE